MYFNLACPSLLLSSSQYQLRGVQYQFLVIFLCCVYNVQYLVYIVSAYPRDGLPQPPPPRVTNTPSGPWCSVSSTSVFRLLPLHCHSFRQYSPSYGFKMY